MCCCTKNDLPLIVLFLDSASCWDERGVAILLVENLWLDFNACESAFRSNRRGAAALHFFLVVFFSMDVHGSVQRTIRYTPRTVPRVLDGTILTAMLHARSVCQKPFDFLRCVVAPMTPASI